MLKVHTLNNTRSNVCKRSSGWINYDNNVHITQPDAKNVPNCDVSFANGELHQAYGHVTLTASMWPKYGHRSLEGFRFPHICSCRFPTTYQRPMIIFWSCTHRQRHVTICLMKFATGERNVTIRYIFCIWLCNMNTVIIHVQSRQSPHSQYMYSQCTHIHSTHVHKTYCPQPHTYSVFGRLLQLMVCPMLQDRCPVCWSVTFVYCGQTVGMIKMPPDTEVGLGPGNTVLDGDPTPPWKGAQQPPLFGPCLLWPNGRPSQPLLSSCCSTGSTGSHHEQHD